MSTTLAAALPYQEPSIATILVITSFLLLLNGLNFLLDRLLFCGLLGQIAIGVAWGAPGANWLSQELQGAIVQLGYLGLILLVYQGGLATDLKTLRSNLFLSSLVALVGISAPIGLSFALRGFMPDITSVQAFAAGAALCSTSLGTTFTILSTSGLVASRLGVVLSSAAMMDDIVGLVMSGVISRLGKSSSSAGGDNDFSPTTVIRPVFVSIAFAVLVPLICVRILKPLTTLGSVVVLAAKRESRLRKLLATESAAILLHLLVLIALVTGASYAGTSNLFAAYLAGAVVTWWDGLRKDIREAHDSMQQGHKHDDNPTKESAPASSFARASMVDGEWQQDRSQNQAADVSAFAESTSTSQLNHSGHPSAVPACTQAPQQITNALSGLQIFDKYLQPPLQTILKPFFFASIGFSIPISRMFTAFVAWRGLVYTILMIVGKLLCGLCLVRFNISLIGRPLRLLKRLQPSRIAICLPWSFTNRGSRKQEHAKPTRGKPGQSETRAPTAPAEANPLPPDRSSGIPKPVSLYPAALLGSAMVARGEIGFLISSVAASDGVFGSSSDDSHASELFLVTTWAILLCTLFGPIVVGLLVKRVKRLQARERSQRTGKEDPLGIWGVIPTTATGGT